MRVHPGVRDGLITTWGVSQVTTVVYGLRAMQPDRWIKPTFTLALGGLVLLAAGSPAHAQQEIPNTPYIAFGATDQAYTPLSGAATLGVTTPNYFRNYRADTQMPFPFKFYDRTTTGISFNVNGAVYFQDSGFSTQYFPSSFSWPLGSPNQPNQFIAPYWNYLEFRPADGVFYEVTGRAPTRVFNIEWRNALGGVRSFGTRFVGRVNMQVRLYEGISGRIDIQYAPDNLNTDYTFAGIMGMEDETGGRAISFATSANQCTGGSCPWSNMSGRGGQIITLVQDPGVELVASGVEVPQFATLGVPIQVPVTVSNAHRNPLGPFEIQVRASRTRDGANSTVIGRASIALGPFQVGAPLIEVLPPVALGENSYFLFLDVDTGSTVDEVDETNNTVRSTSTVRFLPSQPDFVVDVVRLSSRQINAGDTIDAFVTVSNAGSESINGTELAVMLSSNPVISANDGVLKMETITLPVGATVTTTIAITIPPETNSGAYYIGALGDVSNNIAEISEANNGRSAISPVDVTGGDIAILTSSLPQAIVQETYVALLAATGGSGDYNWEVSAGTLPGGIGVVAATGEFFGRPTGAGCEEFTMSLTDRQNPGAAAATQVLELCVTTLTEPLTVVTRDVPPAVVGQEYTFQLIATGGVMGGAQEWSGTDLPEGFQITSMGMLIGTGATEGSTDFEAVVANGDTTARRTINLEVQANGNLQIQAEPLPVGKVDEPYTYQFRSNGGIEPITWLLQLGNLTDIGLDLTPDGQISGAPSRAGRFRFTVEARDAGPPGRAARDENSFELIIEDDDALEITTTGLPAGAVDAGYDRAVAAIGGLPPYTWRLEKGRLPEGLTGATNPISNEFRIAGTPTEEISANILVSATDSEGRTTARAYVLQISPAAEPVVIDEDDGCAATNSGNNLATIFLMVGFGLIMARRRRR